MYVCTQWRWVWLGSRSWWLTGKPGMLWSVGSWRGGHDWATELNWTVCIKILAWLDQFSFLLLLLHLFFFFLVSFFEELCGRQWLPCPVLLLGNFLDKGTWQVRIYGVTRIGHDWVNATFLVFSILYSYKIFSHLFLELSLWICH